MNRRALLVLALAAAACAPARTAPPPVAPPPQAPPTQAPPTQAPPTQASPRPAEPAAGVPAVREAPPDWHVLDAGTDGLRGIGLLRAERELLAGRTPKRTVVVAILDGGVDTAHVDLRANLWTNEREAPANGRDDDGNGYVDDVRGWSFLGGRDGQDVRWDSFEVTRLHALCTGVAGAGAGPLPPAQRERCPDIAEAWAGKKAEAEQTLQQIRLIGDALERVRPVLRQAAGTDSLTAERVAAIRSTDPVVLQARQLFLQLAQNGITEKVIAEAREAYESQVEYGYNLAFDPRSIVGDSYADTAERLYGNNNVMGPDAKHGTHVAGIVGAVRDNGIGVDGIAPAVRIMSVRTVPDGDERDKDVANAIRYAVDNGAHIINMSFGKAWSPYKSVVDEAVKYADARGVLLVHAAGNDGKDLSREANYPNRVYLDGGSAANWIEVGASTWRGADTLAAAFSNWGPQQVDVFAPGEDITSTVPGGGYEAEDGTSMAAPVVSGLAALIMAHFPELDAADVKRVILESATRYTDLPVRRPGPPGGQPVPFGTLSITGGVVNAYAAVQRAEELAATKR